MRSGSSGKRSKGELSRLAAPAVRTQAAWRATDVTHCLWQPASVVSARLQPYRQAPRVHCQLPARSKHGYGVRVRAQCSSSSAAVQCLAAGAAAAGGRCSTLPAPTPPPPLPPDARDLSRTRAGAPLGHCGHRPRCSQGACACVEEQQLEDDTIGMRSALPRPVPTPSRPSLPTKPPLAHRSWSVRSRRCWTPSRVCRAAARRA